MEYFSFREYIILVYQVIETSQQGDIYTFPNILLATISAVAVSASGGNSNESFDESLLWAARQTTSPKV